MAFQILLNRKTSGKIDNLKFDLVLNENHIYENLVTENPVEDGFDVTDNVYKKPPELSFEGFISDTPLVQTDADQLADLEGFGVQTRTETALIRLLEIAGYDLNTGLIQDKEPLIMEVFTSIRVYQDMVISKITMPFRNNSIKIKVEFKHINIVSAQTTDIPVVNETKAPNQKNQGTKTINTNNQKLEKQKTVVKRIADFFRQNTSSSSTPTGVQQ